MKAAPAPEENVAINVVPMVDIMFLLLLFFMLGADMSHRENVELMLPEADKAVDQKTDVGDAPYVNINIHSTGNVDTPAARADEANWSYQIAGEDYQDYWELINGRPDGRATGLKVIADRKRETVPVPGTNIYLSAVTATIRSDKDAPYGMIQKAMQACADPSVGIYMIEVGAAKPPE